MKRLNDLVSKFRYAIRRHGIIGTLGVSIDRIAALVNSLRPSVRAESQEREQRAAEFDERYGVDTLEVIHHTKLRLNSNNPNQLHAVSYGASDPKFFRDAIWALPIDYQYFVFIDFGSGKGRAILMATEFSFKKIVGVEFSEELHRIAQDNIIRFPIDMFKCKDVEFVCMDAVAYPLPDDCLVCYFFNPFDATIMDQVLSNIQKSFLRNPRKIYIVYYNPRAGYLFDQADWLQEVTKIGPVRIWRTTRKS